MPTLDAKQTYELVVKLLIEHHGLDIRDYSRIEIEKLIDALKIALTTKQ